MTQAEQMTQYFIDVFWDDSYKQLDYKACVFNDPDLKEFWLKAGYPDRFAGEQCDMKSRQPSWNQRFVDMFAEKGWKDIGTLYHRMPTGTILPVHGDLYVRYIDFAGLTGQEHRLRRAIVFLEDWKSGHYFEGQGQPVVNWKAGTVMEWSYDTPHMAANIGLEPRYTLQITGWM
jgi:hypothetical protein